MKYAGLAAMILAPGAAAAATLDAYVSASVTMGGLGAPSSAFDLQEYEPDTVETLSDGRTVAAAATGPFGTGAASATYSVDGVRGQMRLGITGAVSDGPGGTGSTGGNVTLDLIEQYFVKGKGRVTVGMSIGATWDAAFWNLTANVGYNGFGYDGLGTLAEVSAGNSSVSFDAGKDGRSGSVNDYLLEAAFDIDTETGGLIDFSWFLAGSAGVPGGGGVFADTAFLNAMNTANLFVRLEGDVSAVAQTAGFLSDPAYDNLGVVPLPASAILLLGGLAGLGALRMTQRRIL